jgi:hypothetical protein
MAPTQNGEKANGAEVVNGISHASSATTTVDTGEKLASRANPKPAPLKLKPTNADRQGVANAFERHAQVIHAKVKPLPNQTGAGTFYETKRWGKLRDDIKTLRSAGMGGRPFGWTNCVLMVSRLESPEEGGHGQAQGREVDRRQDHDHGTRHSARLQPAQQLKAPG